MESNNGLLMTHSPLPHNTCAHSLQTSKNLQTPVKCLYISTAKLGVQAKGQEVQTCADLAIAQYVAGVLDQP